MASIMSIRLPQELAKNLTQIARETERSKAFHVQKALENYIREIADLQIAMDRLKNPSDEIVDAKEMREMLGL